MKFKLLTFCTLLATSTISCSDANPLSMLADDTSPVIEAESQSALVRFQNAFRSTVTYISLEKKDIDSFFARGGKIINYDLSDVHKPLNDLIDSFKFKSITASAKKSDSLISIEFEAGDSFKMPSESTLAISEKVAIDGFGETAEGNWLFNLSGFTWDAVNVDALEWNPEEGAILHLANDQKTPMAIDAFVEYYDAHEDEISELVMKIEGTTSPTSLEVINGTMAVFDWFKTTNTGNNIHMPINSGSEWYETVQKYVDKVAATDRNVAFTIKKLKQLHVNTRQVTMDLKHSIRYSLGSERVLLTKRVVLTPLSTTAFRIKGVSGGRANGRRNFSIYHGRIKNNGYITYSIALPFILGGNQGRNYRIPGA